MSTSRQVNPAAVTAAAAAAAATAAAATDDQRQLTTTNDNQRPTTTTNMLDMLRWRHIDVIITFYSHVTYLHPRHPTQN